MMSLAIGLLLVQFLTVDGIKSVSVSTWLTTSDPVSGDALKILELQPAESIVKSFSDHSKTSIISIDTSQTLQTIVGYGAGLPQSSASVLLGLKRRLPSVYDSVMQKMFGSSADGVGISALRFPVGSCDFSIQNTSYDEHYNDFDLSWFALDSDSEYIVEFLQDAVAINPQITLIASPWSPPSWMKTLGTLIANSESNTLIDSDQVYSSYANYFEKVVTAFLSRNLTIAYVTLQNEPLFGTSTEYPGMYFDAKQSARLARHVRNVLPKSVGILAYDHNWDHPEYPVTVINSEPQAIAGVAWHCYGGSMAPALDQVQSKFPYPSYPQHITECTGGFPNDTCDISQGLSGFGFNHEWDMQNLFLGASSHFAVSGIKWIIALDENCGPVLPLVSWRSGRPLVSIPSSASSYADIKFNQDFWTIAHMSKFIPPKSIRVLSNVDSSNSINSLLTESFLSSTSDCTTTLVMNLDKSTEAQIEIKKGVDRFSYILPPFSTGVFRWNCEL